MKIEIYKPAEKEVPVLRLALKETDAMIVLHVVDAEGNAVQYGNIFGIRKEDGTGYLFAGISSDFGLSLERGAERLIVN